jgi:hypothetical protein
VKVRRAARSEGGESPFGASRRVKLSNHEVGSTARGPFVLRLAGGTGGMRFDILRLYEAAN